MEKITYRLTLDTFKGGIQKVLRGVYTGDVLSRRVAISLSAGSVPCKISDEESSVSAVMYVTKPSGVTNYGNCEIVDNVVYYDIIQYDVDVEGIVEMQLKVMSEDSVLYAPVFALEVQQSKNSDTIAEQSPQFTALEAALARAEEVYRKRLVSIELTDDLVFIAHYGDNSTYESDAIKNALAFVDDAEKARVIAENERVLAEEQRVLAELERVLAEQRRNSNYDNLWTSLNEVIKDTEELQKYVESLVEEGFITESRVLELIEEHGGGAVPDNVLVASEESAQTEPAPKVNADLFGGHGEDYFASAEDIENITNGTTQVGNAKMLDGHGAEYFASTEAVSYIQNKSDGTLNAAGWYRVAEYDCTTYPNVRKGVYPNSCDVTVKNAQATITSESHMLRLLSAYNHQRIVSVGSISASVNRTFTKARYTYDDTKAYFEVYYAQNTSNPVTVQVANHAKFSVNFSWKAITPTLTSETVSGVTVTTTYDIPADTIPETNADLANYLPLDGGTQDTVSRPVRTPVVVRSTHGSSTDTLIGFKKNDTWSGFLGIDGQTNPVFVNGGGTEKQTLLHTGNMADHVLPKSGGAVNGTLEVSGSEIVVDPLRVISNHKADNRVLIEFRKGSAVQGYLGFYGGNNPIFVNIATGASHTLFHDGNKPTGSYTGNGDATAREIATNGVGYMVLILGTAFATIVTPFGGITVDVNGTSVLPCASGNVKFSNGIITISSNDVRLNSSGTTYTYQVL